MIPLMPTIGPVELAMVLLLVVMLFGVGKLPEVFKSMGSGLREFKNALNPDPPKKTYPPLAAKFEEDALETEEGAVKAPQRVGGEWSRQ